MEMPARFRVSMGVIDNCKVDHDLGIVWLARSVPLASADRALGRGYAMLGGAGTRDPRLVLLDHLLLDHFARSTIPSLRLSALDAASFLGRRPAGGLFAPEFSEAERRPVPKGSTELSPRA